MSSVALHHARFSFLLDALIPQAVQDNYALVQTHFDNFVQAYDPGMAKAAGWRNVDYAAVHQWVEDNSSTPGEFDANWALAASAVFFRFQGSGTSGIPDPCPGCWSPTALRAHSINTSGSQTYDLVWLEAEQKWVMVCISGFSLATTDQSPPMYPEVVVDGVVIATIRGRLDYGQRYHAVT